MILLSDIETRKKIRTLKGHSDYVFSIAINSKGDRILSGSRDKTVKLWNLETAEVIKTINIH